MLALRYIQTLINNGQQAFDKVNKDNNEITELDIQQALGLLDLERDLEAAKILLREELKERRLTKEDGL
ncbi:hypothetical protein [Sporosarcina globispora]|uniref:hypothetical protein n=1 Tax=Sporosarcina globispora TaxID=1459 RepID=UPI0006A97C9E|nr:hypothetical protein [Sporosarcina globispora]